jgi:hypothetical protein
LWKNMHAGKQGKGKKMKQYVQCTPNTARPIPQYVSPVRLYF